MSEIGEISMSNIPTKERELTGSAVGVVDRPAADSSVEDVFEAETETENPLDLAKDKVGEVKQSEEFIGLDAEEKDAFEEMLDEFMEDLAAKEEEDKLKLKEELIAFLRSIAITIAFLRLLIPDPLGSDEIKTEFSGEDIIGLLPQTAPEGEQNTALTRKLFGEENEGSKSWAEFLKEVGVLEKTSFAGLMASVFAANSRNMPKVDVPTDETETGADKKETLASKAQGLLSKVAEKAMKNRAKFALAA